jgi:hypothetical protein
MSGEPPAGESLSGEAGVAIIGRRGIVPAPLLAELIRSGATVRHLRRPVEAPESGYRPSTPLVEFVRVRNTTHRFPNCDLPAELCGIDRRVQRPLGPAHPSNLKCVCRNHYRVEGVRLNCDAVVWIPMAGPAESLNAAVAAGVVLAEVSRQRRR